ncbi:MAG: AF1514 family protein [Thermodesulfobacteriota bacterium]
MKEIDIQISGCNVSQGQAQEIGQLLAEQDNPDSMVISRFNRAANACSPCCLKGALGEKPAWEVYGENHGGQLKITVNKGDYIFIFS